MGEPSSKDFAVFQEPHKGFKPCISGESSDIDTGTQLNVLSP